jgi:hypothetical protein
MSSTFLDNHESEANGAKVVTCVDYLPSASEARPIVLEPHPLARR